MQPNLETVRTLAQKHPDVITEGSLRWEIFMADENGLKESGAIIRRGRKILIDADRYFVWIYSDNQLSDSAIKKEAAVTKRRRKRSSQSRAVVSA